MADTILLSGFLKWETGAGDVRLCDGGTLPFDGERYQSTHPVFGAISGFNPISEGIGDEAPGGRLTFSPDPDAPPGVINTPALQGSRIRMWIGEVDPDAGALVAPPDLMLDSVVDATTLQLGRGTRQLPVDIVSRAERLFLLAEGNVLSGESHRRIYPAERGLENAIGVPQVVAWGVVGAPRGTSVGGGGGGVGAGGSAMQQ